MRGERDRILASLPNLPAPDAPDHDEVLREVGDAGARGRDHLELAGPRIDMERAARVSGSRFAYLLGDLAMLELTLVRYALEKVRGEGFEPVIPPVLVREEALYGTGMLPDTEQQIYRLADDELYLVGTSEVPLASLHRDEILAADQLPARYAGYSSCFRREAGAAGKDTRGIFRVHQFEKVEMFSFVAPEDSPTEHERLLSIEESILSELEIPYRVVAIAVDDLGATSATGPRTGNSPTCIRSTERRSRSGGRSWRCSRMGSGTTAPSCSPRRWSPGARRRCCLPPCPS